MILGKIRMDWCGSSRDGAVRQWMMRRVISTFPRCYLARFPSERSQCAQFPYTYGIIGAYISPGVGLTPRGLLVPVPLAARGPSSMREKTLYNGHMHQRDTGISNPSAGIHRRQLGPQGQLGPTYTPIT